MKKKIIAAFICLAALSLLAGSVQESTCTDQDSIEITVYNQNMGLVKDTRTLSLTKGVSELRFMDVAAAIKPETVLIKSLNQPNQFGVYEQNYEYDLISRSRLLDKYVGKELKIRRQSPDLKETKIVSATLLANNNGPVFQIGNEIHVDYAGQIILPEMPENLIAKPTLTWLLNNESKKPHQVEVSYMTDNITWKADYVLNVDKMDKFGDLTGWVTVDNKSGATYKNAKLKLVAGEVNRVQPEVNHYFRGRPQAENLVMDSVGFQEESFFEYHLYDLQRPATIKDKQQKQICLLQANQFKIKKELMVSANGYYYDPMTEMKDEKVEVFLKIKNSKENMLGMPLPKGIIRTYKEDSKGKKQFIGEDRIEHTPKNETVSLKMGEAFDVKCRTKQTNFKRVSDRIIENDWQVEFSNHKEEDVVIRYRARMTGDWKIKKNSHKFEKINAHLVEFTINVPADGKVNLTYWARTKF